jgi:hypothetical protein
MSRYVNNLNKIRQGACEAWLTPCQRLAYNLLRERLQFLDAVNLWGEHGSGKTFIGWVLNKEEPVAYVPRLDDIPQAVNGTQQDTIIVDNLSWRRTHVREALYRCHSYGYRRIVLITNEPVMEQIATVEVRILGEDLADAAANLRSIFVAPTSDTSGKLWSLVSTMRLPS